MVAMPHHALSLRVEDLTMLAALSDELGVAQADLLSLAVALGLDRIRDHLEPLPPVPRNRRRRTAARLHGVKGQSPFDSQSALGPIQGA